MVANFLKSNDSLENYHKIHTYVIVDYEDLLKITIDSLKKLQFFDHMHI